MESFNPASHWSAAEVRRTSPELIAPRATPSLDRDSAALPILIIDDDAIFASTMAQALPLEGYTVSHAMSGRQGIDLALNGSFAALVLDQSLPDVPGEHVLAKIRAFDEEVPVVVVTGVCLDEEHERRARALGVSDYLRKPVWTENLVLALRTALGSAAPPNVGDRSEDGGYPPGTNDALEAVWPDLCRRLQSAWRGVSPQAIVDGLDDAVLERLRQDDIKAVHRTELSRTLFWSAWRNIANSVESEKRRRVREGRYGREAAARARAMLSETTDDVTRRREEAVALVAQTPPESRALVVWLERGGWQEMAAALGFAESSEAEQRDVVRRFKDRLLKRAAKLRQ